MASTYELLINVVNQTEPQMLKGSSKREVVGCRCFLFTCRRQTTTIGEQAEPHSSWYLRGTW
jgi:hypothetical protein